MKNVRVSLILFTFAVVFFVLSAGSAFAAAVSLTVCDVGCDHTSLSDALSDPGLDADAQIDTITLTDDYSFVYVDESSPPPVPSGVTIICDSGAENFGDAGLGTIDFTTNSNFTLQGCTMKNVDFEVDDETNISFLNNTFSPNAGNDDGGIIDLQGVDTFEISGNDYIQRILIQTSDNGLIEDNKIDCRINNGCLNISSSASNDTEYADDQYIPNDILITENTITNFRPASNGDWVNVYGGENIQFVENTFLSDVVMDDIYMAIISVSDAQVDYIGNTVISPEKAAGATNGMWIFNSRYNGYEMTLLYENNTVIMQNTPSGTSGDACIGFFGGGAGNPVNDDVTITARYNLCYQSNSNSPGPGINLTYAPGTGTVTLNHDYNGFFNMNDPGVTLEGAGAPAPTVNAGTIINSDPLFRTENVDTSDDLHPSPISRYYDIDGTNDIGAHSGIRISNYLIDDDCTVDYSSCFSNTTDVLTHSLTDGDVVNIGGGTYVPFTISGSSGGSTNITVSGATGGSATVIASPGASSALTFDGVDNSTIENLTLQDANTSTISYYITKALWVYNGNTYDDSLPLTGVANEAVFVASADCTSQGTIPSDGTEVTTAVGDASSDWTVGLTDIGGQYLTVYVPSDFITGNGYALDTAGFTDYAADICGMVVITDQVIPGIFTSNGDGTLSYNAAAVAAASASLKPGNTTPPELYRTVVSSAGIKMLDSDNNTLENLTLSNNGYGIWFSGTSSGNSLEESTISSNNLVAVKSDSSADNAVKNVEFQRGTSEISGTGIVEAWYKVRAFLKDSANNPISSAAVTFTDALGTLAQTLSTDASGYTAYSDNLHAYNMTSTSIEETEGGFNPYTLNGSSTSVQQNINERNQTVEIIKQVVQNQNRGGGGIILLPKDKDDDEDKDADDVDQETEEDDEYGESVHQSGDEGSTVLTDDSTPCLFTEDSPIPFTDINNHWAGEYIKELYLTCVMTGKTETLFAPDELITRAELVDIVLRKFNLSRTEFEQLFKDVNESDLFASEITAAAKQGIVQGYTAEEDNSGEVPFKPEKFVSRSEALKIILGAKGINVDSEVELNKYKSVFVDVPDYAWFYNHVAYAENKDVVDGYVNAYFKPDQQISRSEVAKILVLVGELE